MASVVFLKGVNVGGHKRFRPAVLARQLANLDVLNIGAAGTFVVRKPISQSELREAIMRFLPFSTCMMICSAKDILTLASEQPRDAEPFKPDTVRFVGILSKPPRSVPILPLNVPPGKDWLVRIYAVRGRFAFGQYRPNMRTIGCLGQIEKHLGAAMTNRNWHMFLKLFEILGGKRESDA